MQDGELVERIHYSRQIPEAATRTAHSAPRTECNMSSNMHNK